MRSLSACPGLAGHGQARLWRRRRGAVAVRRGRTRIVGAAAGDRCGRSANDAERASEPTAWRASLPPSLPACVVLHRTPRPSVRRPRVNNAPLLGQSSSLSLSSLSVSRRKQALIAYARSVDINSVNIVAMWHSQTARPSTAQPAGNLCHFVLELRRV